MLITAIYASYCAQTALPLTVLKRRRLPFHAGVLLRRLQSDPELSGVGAILFDEFHERNLDADCALTLCLDLQVGDLGDLDA